MLQSSTLPLLDEGMGVGSSKGGKQQRIPHHDQNTQPLALIVSIGWTFHILWAGMRATAAQLQTQGVTRLCQP